MKDLHNNIDVTLGIAPYDHGSGDAEILTEIIDTQGYESLEFLIATGSLADSDATFAVDMEDGDNSALSDTAAVADSMLLGTEALAGFTFAEDNQIFKIGYNGDKRYVRLGITPTDNTGVALLCVIALLGNPSQSPTANPPVMQ